MKKGVCLDYIVEYQRLDYDNFVKFYENSLMYFLERQRSQTFNSNFENNYKIINGKTQHNTKNINIKLGEEAFLLKLLNYLNKRYLIMDKYFKHCDNRNKYKNWFYKMAVEKAEHNKKMQFVDYKLSKLIDVSKLESYYHDTNSSQKPKSLLLEGKRLNLAERFQIAIRTIGINKLISELNISDMEKYALLSYILGCDETNARHLMNNSYDANIREEIIQKYLGKIK